MRRLKKNSSDTDSARERVFLSIGTNIGDRERNLYDAVAEVGRYLTPLICSSVYETRPMYVADQPLFLNVVCHGETALHPSDVLSRVQQIEGKMGRDRSTATVNGPRIIDIDVLLFGERTICEENLIIPHPRMKERKFVLVPLVEIAPDVRDPISGDSYAHALELLDDQGIYYFNMKRYSLQDHGG